MRTFKTDSFKGIIVGLLILVIILFSFELIARIVAKYNQVYNVNISGYSEFHPYRGRQLKPG